jgi:S-adenosylmethionine synthetase
MKNLEKLLEAAIQYSQTIFDYKNSTELQQAATTGYVAGYTICQNQEVMPLQQELALANSQLLTTNTVIIPSLRKDLTTLQQEITYISFMIETDKNKDVIIDYLKKFQTVKFDPIKLNTPINGE